MLALPGLIAAAASPLAASPALAQAAAGSTAPDAWPTRPVRLLVGFPGGSSPDLTARLIAEPLAQALGQPVYVENKPGASGNIATDAVAKATDGHTLGLMINGNMTIARLLNPHTPYDPLKDLAPISLIGSAPLVLTATHGVAFRDIADFFVAARQAGDRWSYGSPGIGTVSHLGMELLAAKSGIQPVHVPYAGNPQVVNALITGELQLALVPPGLALPQAQAGKVRLVGITSKGRSAVAPGVPSLAEGGIPDYQVEVWNAVAGPAAMPAARAQRLSRLVNDILRRPEIREKLLAQGWQTIAGSPEALRLRMQADTAQMGEVIHSRHIHVD
ncbi:MAG: tripartite tricarboxylate transporter substrate binding protein [Comamonas sp.]